MSNDKSLNNSQNFGFKPQIDPHNYMMQQFIETDARFSQPEMDHHFPSLSSSTYQFIPEKILVSPADTSGFPASHHLEFEMGA